MPRFFVSEIAGEQAFITGQDAWHLFKVLRLRTGDAVTLCDGNGTEAEGELVQADERQAEVKILSRQKSPAEPTVKIKLYQALPKGDKLEFIVQKAVELGVGEIIPVLSHRCVSRPDPKAMEKKRERCQRVAEEAAKQSGRGLIPQIGALTDLKEAIKQLSLLDCGILFYENAALPLKQALSASPREIGILIGPEGGFEPEEVALAEQAGLSVLSLGKRILRCETAPLCALSILMYETGNI